MTVESHMSTFAIRLVAIFALLAATMLGTAQAEVKDEIVFFHVDAVGSATAAYNEAGDLCWKQDYTPYGEQTRNDDANPVAGCGLIGKDRGFTGHTQDESGLTYMQQRYYDASIGRFVSVDPVGVDAHDPRTYNRYSYAANNPYRYVDPDGRKVKLSTGAENSEIADAFNDLRSDPVSGPMIETLEKSDKLYTISTREEALTGTWLQSLINFVTGVDPATDLGATYLDGQRTIAITPGVQAEVFDFASKKKVVIPHSGVLAHELGHAFVHETRGIGRGRGGQTEAQIHSIVDNVRQNIRRSTTGRFIPGASSR